MGGTGPAGPAGPTGTQGPPPQPQVLWTTMGPPSLPTATGPAANQTDLTIWGKRALNPANNYSPPCDSQWWFGAERKAAPGEVCDTAYTISGNLADKKISRVGMGQGGLVNTTEIPFTTTTTMN